MKDTPAAECASITGHHIKKVAAVLALTACLLAGPGCANPGPFTEKGRDAYYGGHGHFGTSAKRHTPAEVQRVEPVWSPRS